MKKINSIVGELKTIMQNNDISQNSVVSLLDGKCSRTTILSFFSGDSDCRLSTLLMIMDVCGAELRIETERSKQAIISGDIAEYRAESDKLRSDLAKSAKDCDFYKSHYEELIEKNSSLTKTIEKQQSQIERYMDRMEKAENALYSSNEDVRRKDRKIVELLSKLEK